MRTCLPGKQSLACGVGVGAVFKALADPTRRALLDEMMKRDGQTLFELCARLATGHGLGSTRQAVSQHLEVLEDAGLITTRRQGRYKFHRTTWTRRRCASSPIDGCQPRGGLGVKIKLTSVLVDDQDRALRFYTDVLGFEKTEVPCRRGTGPGFEVAAPGTTSLGNPPLAVGGGQVCSGRP